MITNKDFDHFLKEGFIEKIGPRSSMKVLIEEFGEDCWAIKERHTNQLIYGIYKVGCIEFHICNEMINGVSYRPDIYFDLNQFIGFEIPWIYEQRTISNIENVLKEKDIGYKKYTLQGPLDRYKVAAGELQWIEEGEHTFIDTEGGVTFKFEEIKDELIAKQVCKYYDIQFDEETGV